MYKNCVFFITINMCEWSNEWLNFSLYYYYYYKKIRNLKKNFYKYIHFTIYFQHYSKLIMQKKGTIKLHESIQHRKFKFPLFYSLFQFLTHNLIYPIKFSFHFIAFFFISFVHHCIILSSGIKVSIRSKQKSSSFHLKHFKRKGEMAG